MNIMKLFSFLILSLCASHVVLAGQAEDIVAKLSLREKIAQKMMLDFRYWCDTKGDENCNQNFTQMNKSVAAILSQNHIGGVILFSNNLVDTAQVTTLNSELQQAMSDKKRLPLFISIDQEGGIVTRLPRQTTVTFPGNMALAAAALGTPNSSFIHDVAQTIAMDVKAVGFNMNFAPDVDVNVNPQNPIINVRSFSDDPTLVADYGLQFMQATQQENIAAALKHFPGHGDTTTDSHLGLPVVSHTLAEAEKIDLYPFEKIISQSPPDVIMTAHIQFPALDNSEVLASKSQKSIIVPATLSRKIQHDLLREKLGFEGVTITDALDMGAIAQNFAPTDATLKFFQADGDIALMPVSIWTNAQAHEITEMINQIEAAVLRGELSEKELNASVLRIIKLKIKLGLMQPETLSVPEKIERAQRILADEQQYKLEREVTNHAVTLLQNKNNVLPIKLKSGMSIHVLTPWLEQGAGIAMAIKDLQRQQRLPADVEVSYVKMADTTLEQEFAAIDHADIIIAGTASYKAMPVSSYKRAFDSYQTKWKSLVFPDMLAGDSESFRQPQSLRMVTDLSDNDFALKVLNYAKSQHKKTIFISLLTPYDISHFRTSADALLVGYDLYGYLGTPGSGYYRGPSMPALARIIFGIEPALGKLPINIPDPADENNIIYQRGFGLTTFSLPINIIQNPIR